jgi:putative hemolysin
MTFELVLIGLLILANGLFSMSEMAVVSARKARLRQRAEAGSGGAAVALELAENPHDFLSTVQVGITLIGTLAGAFGGATVAEKLAVYLKEIPAIAPHAETAAISAVVLVITYLSLIVGELVPKSLALAHAEAIASAVAPSMRLLARIGAPVVAFLTVSTRLVTILLPIQKSDEAPVTEEEVKVLIAQGTEYGTFAEAEQEMVEGVFRLGDRRVSDLMKPRNRVVSLDASADWPSTLRVLRESEYSRFPVIGSDRDPVIGVIHVKDVLLAIDAGPVELRRAARRALFVLEITPALDLLERFQESGEQMALVIDEHGGFQGIVTLTDLLESVVGDLRGPSSGPRPAITPQADGSWMADGAVPFSTVREALALAKSPEDRSFTTLAGFLLASFRRIPAPGDSMTAGGWRFEVTALHANRIDKVHIVRDPH